MNPVKEFRIGAWATPPGVIDPAMRKIGDERILLATSGPPTPVEVNCG
jgi:hypothetical protein